MSRHQFESLTSTDIDKLAKEAFARMDRQLDLTMQSLLTVSQSLNVSKEEYLESEFKEIWNDMDEFMTTIVDSKMFYKTETELFL